MIFQLCKVTTFFSKDKTVAFLPSPRRCTILWRERRYVYNMESQNTEYKRSWKDEYLKWICGFANAQGGTIYIGIDDNGDVCGITDAKKLMEDIPNKISMSMGVVADVNLLHKDGKEYIAISVAKCGSPISFKGKYYYRTGSTLQELNGTALQDFILRKMNTSWDASIVQGATVEDIDHDAIDFFLHSAIKQGRINEDALKDDIAKILHNLNLTNDSGQLTMAALLLFGKDIQRWCSTATFRIGRFGTSQADLITQDTISCPLVMMPGKIITTLRSKYLISPIHYEGLQRMEPLEIPEDGLREMICNAIVHKDYLGPFIQMRVWNDRIELWNSGTLPIGFTIDTLLGRHESYPRNTLIANAFYLAGFIENWGRGYEKIRKAFADEHLQMPVFEQVRGGVMATIIRERFISYDTKDDTKDDTKELSERQQIILQLIKKDPLVTIPEMVLKIGASRSTILRDLAILQSKGIITRVGGRKEGKWILVQ